MNPILELPDAPIAAIGGLGGMGMNEDLSLLGPPVILTGILNGIGAWLKSIPKFPNWLIPVILPVLGAAIYPFLFKMPDIGDEWMKGPDVNTLVKCCYGFGIGLSAVGTHQLVQNVKPQPKENNEPEKPSQ